ncbi:MAG: radical SAM protein [Desulfurococcaceae archaeon]
MRKPEYVIWIFTAACNLDCLHCYTYRFRNLRELPLSEKLRIARSIGETGVEYVNLTGGEPLIHPQFKDIVLELHKYGVEKSVVTNATMVKDDVVDLLYRTETYVFATIEGPREIHDKIRGKGSYDRAVRGIEKIAKNLNSLSLVTTVNKVNYRYVQEVVDYAASVDVDSLALLPVMPSGRALETGVYVEPGEYVIAFKSVYERAREYGLKLSAWCTPFAPLLKLDISSWFCRDMSGFDIDPAGNVLLCDTLDMVLTSVVGKSILEVYEEFLNHHQVEYVRNPPNLPRECRTCVVSYACRGGCFARAYALKRDLNAGDPLCPRVSKLPGY